MHKSVMIKEVIEILQPKDGSTYIDATFGAGGYTKAILSSANCKVIAIDQDPLAQKYALDIKGNFEFISGNFGNLSKLITDKVDGIVFDIGISSMQIDNADRGFSYTKDGPLDMRMNSAGQTAADFLNSASHEEIANVIYKYGEDRNSRNIATKIIAARPLTSTLQLAKVIGHPNSVQKTFQAIRIFINNELEMLENGLKDALQLLKTGGKLIVVTFHSLEDRIVKLFFKSYSAPKTKQNRYLQNNQQKNKSALELITKKAIMPTEVEIKSNSRSKSAKLRAALKREEI